MSFSAVNPRAFHRFARFVVLVAILLVWWGAATTTKQAGMVFADWPLSLGSFNPPGWLENMIPFLEHSHRLLAKLTGFLVLALFCWAYVRSGKRAFEVFFLVMGLAVVLAFFIVAGSERTDAGEKRKWLGLALVLASLPISWLVWSWRSRSWNLLEKLTALALLMVTAQAILGGLRVTEISNAFAVVHGCFAQAFFCVLILIAMVSSEAWPRNGFRMEPGNRWAFRFPGIVLTALVSLQLIFGASMRHFHRHALVDDGLIKTQGQWIPSFDDPVIAMLFLHKFNALCVLLFAIGMVIKLHSRSREASRYASGILGLILIQVIIGLSVIVTGKSFWVTNVHVLNGLAILAFAFVFTVKSLRAISIDGTLAKP